MIDKRLQCKSTYQAYQLWHVKKICKQLLPEVKQELLLQIQAKAQLLGEPVVNQEAYEAAIRLLKEEGNVRRMNCSWPSNS